MRKNPNIRWIMLPLTEPGEDRKRTGGGRGVYIQWHFGEFNFWIIITMNQLCESLNQGRGPGREFRRRG